MNGRRVAEGAALAEYPRFERRLIARLNGPERVQHFVDRLPYNWEPDGETLRSVRSSLAAKTAHCLEAALIACALLEPHGYPPLLLDLESVDKLDHVLFVFQRAGRWGAVARSRDPGLHGRKAVFATLRALVASYELPYIDATGRICGYGVLDLREVRRCDWRFSPRNVWAIERALIDNRHHRVRMPEATYRRWLARYLRFCEQHPGARPVYYPQRSTWLSAGEGCKDL